jgi:penicillin-binding protein 2
LSWFLFIPSATAHNHQLPTDGPLTVRPLLQRLGQKLLHGKQGSIVAIEPQTGKVLCLVTNSPKGENIDLAIATAYAPGSTIKTANGLIFLSEGIVSPETRIACPGYFLDGNIRVGCHRHRSPINMRDALAISCNTWFLSSFMAMVNDRFIYGNNNEALSTWHSYITSMGLGGPLGIDLPGEKGGLVANPAYLQRRYKNGWDARTVMWVAMGQGDITVTPLQLANLAASIANRGYYLTPHIHAATADRPLDQRFTERHNTNVRPETYATVIAGMRQAIINGTASTLNTNYPICGKTGTIENAGKDHGAFIGFAPMNQPKIAIAVYIEHSGFGADMAAPIAGLIIEEYLKGKLSPRSQSKAKRLEAKSTF